MGDFTSTLPKRYTTLPREGVYAPKNYVPDSFEDMFANYYHYVVRQVMACGISKENSEDVAMKILIKFYEKDVLSDYNPDFETTHSGTTRKAVFRTFLTGFVNVYVRHFVDRQRIHKHREGFSADTVIIQGADGSQDQTWLDLNAGSVEDDYDRIEVESLVYDIRAHLLTITKARSKDLCDFPKLFELVLEQVYLGGSVDTKELANVFGVSLTTINTSWLPRLRKEVRGVIEAR